MKLSEIEKYLGDFVTKNCNSKDTIKTRNIRVNAIISEIRAILKDNPLGNRRTQIGILLRKAWFLNGCFFNSEVWTGFTETDLNYLNMLDHQIIRIIAGAQAKAPTEMLYLECAQIPVKYVIYARRIMYLHNILIKHEEELIKRVYFAMKEAPLKNDWSITVKRTWKI